MKVLIVDGYNAIHKIPEIDDLLDESLEDARNAITDLAREYQRRCGGISEVYVVFDGRDEYRGLSLNKPNQVFSKTGEGDRSIIRLAQNKSGKFHVIVVSDDNRVGNSSRAAGATVISVKKFYEFIR
ncbi:MAG: NYN domain-containing protein [Candidatus Omnitrophota bacterium]|jgi:predicted RNA-binding protein with PIN domain|nr:NYN domain-containing protein [Candidatus Omnitrophota bacterium]